jgi:hypothetical protein
VKVNFWIVSLSLVWVVKEVSCAVVVVEEGLSFLASVLKVKKKEILNSNILFFVGKY